jgi:hypothetical protein
MSSNTSQVVLVAGGGITTALHNPARRWHRGEALFEHQVMRRWL